MQRLLQLFQKKKEAVASSALLMNDVCLDRWLRLRAVQITKCHGVNCNLSISTQNSVCSGDWCLFWTTGSDFTIRRPRCLLKYMQRWSTRQNLIKSYFLSGNFENTNTLFTLSELWMFRLVLYFDGAVCSFDFQLKDNKRPELQRCFAYRKEAEEEEGSVENTRAAESTP